MAFEHFDNFGQYGVGQQARLLNGIYAENTNVEIKVDPDPAAPAGSTVLYVNGRPGRLRYVLGGARTKVGMAGRIWLTAVPDSILRSPQPFTFCDALNNVIVSTHIMPTGSIAIYNTISDEATILAETDGPVITANTWWHFECWLTLNGVGGAHIEIRREGLVVLDADLPTITAPACYQVRYAHERLSNFVVDLPWYLKDPLIMNDLTEYNNGFAGSLVVYMLQTTSDIALNWATVGGTNGFSILDNVPADDSIYLVAGTPPPGPYVGTLSNLPEDVTSVRSVMTCVRAQKVDGGDGNLQVGLISDGVTGNGANRPITAGMSYWRDFFNVDPATNSPWLPGAVDDADFTMNRTL